MDRLSQLRGGAGGSRDSSLDGSAAGDSFLTANDTPSKYYSLSEDDSSFEIKDITLEPSTSGPPLDDSDCFSNLSPIGKKDLFGKIEAANILSGGVNIFDDNDNSCDGNELVIDDNVDAGDNSSSLKSPEGPAPESQGEKAEDDKSSTLKLPGSSTPLLQGNTVEDKDQSPSENTPGSSGLPPPNENPPSVESQDSSDHALQDENMDTSENPPSVESLVSLESQESSEPPLEAGIEQVENGNVLLDQDAGLPVQNGDLPLEQAAEIRHLPIQPDGELVENGNHVDGEDQVNNLAENRAEVVLQIDGNNVAAINIGTGLYLYRREGQDELAAVQIIDDDEPSFKFLKVRENDEGNLEVYEEIQEVIVVSQGRTQIREERQVAPVPSTSRETNKPANEPSTSKKVEKKDNTPDKDAPVPSTSKQNNEPNKDAQGEFKPELNLNGKMVKFNESKKSPLMAYHSTPNKEGIPLTKTMVDQQLHPNRHSDNIKKTIEVHTDHSKQRFLDMPSTSKDYIYISPEKEDVHQAEKPMDTENSDKKPISIVKKQLPEVVEKKADDVAGCSNAVAGCSSAVAGCSNAVAGCSNAVAGCSTAVASKKIELEQSSKKVEVEIASDQVEVQKASEKVEIEKASEKVEVQKPREKVEVEKTSEKVEMQEPSGELEVQKLTGIVKVQKPSEKVMVQKQSENVEMLKPIENVEMQKPSEKVEMQKLREQVEMKKTIENVEMQKPRENVELQKLRGKVEIQKPIENVEMQKPSEKVEVQKPREKVEMQKPIENVDMQKPSEKVEVQKPREKVEMQKPIEKIEMQKPIEKIEMQKPREKVEVQKPKEEVEVQKPSEKVIVQKTSERIEVEKPNYKLDVTKPNEKLEKKPSDKVEVPQPIQKVEVEKSSEKAVLEKFSKAVIAKKTNENVCVERISEKVDSIDKTPIVNMGEKKSETVENLETPIKTSHTSGPIEILHVTKENTRTVLKDVIHNEKPSTSYSSTICLPTMSMGEAPMEIDNLDVKVSEIVVPKVNLVVMPTEIMESDDMEIDEDALVIEEQIIEGPRDIDESNKQEIKSLAPSVEILTKTQDVIKEDKQSKTQHLETSNVKPTTSVETKAGTGKIFATNTTSKVDIPNSTKVDNINMIKKDAIIANRSEVELKARDSLKIKEAEITMSKDIRLNNSIKILENRVIKDPTPPKEKEMQDIKRIEQNKGPVKFTVTESISTDKTYIVNSSHNKPASKLELSNNIIEKKVEIPVKEKRDVKAPILFSIKEPQSSFPINTQNLAKPLIINRADIKTAVVNVAEAKKEVNHKPILSTVEPKPKSINNNHAPVPFGKWTEANRQDFLNKIKESKPVHVVNTNQIKQPNDLNRRDVLKKIDSQRQTYNANVKIQESLQKGNAKTETAFASKAVPVTVPKREIKPPVKPVAAILKPKPILNTKPVQVRQQPPPEPTVPVASVSNASKKETQRKEINNQDLIDKTIEGIINRAVTGKSSEDVKQTVNEKPIEKHDKKPEQKPNTQPTLLDAIEMKMNELHGIPFVERPPHELPRPYMAETKASAKAETHVLPLKVTKIPNLLPLTKSQQKLKDCENDIVNLEMPRDKLAPQSLLDSKPVEKPIANPAHDTTKDKVITEKEFDRFARRNSVTYENCLTVTDTHQVVQTMVPREAPPKKISRNEQMLAEAKAKSPHKHLPVKQYHSSKAANKYIPVSDQNKQYHSKLQLAYQTAITAKRRMDSPITIIEDKPVKVVYLDSVMTEFKATQLNVQGRDLSPAKRVAEPDAITIGTNDSLDSDILDAIDDVRSSNQDEAKTKSKHQRKQVLTPVETPDLELIEPGDIGIEVSPRKKRKVEDRPEKISKSLVPKKSYLLGRNVPAAEPTEPTVPKESPPNAAPPVVHNDAVSAIDNLVKAAELLDNQSESMNASSASVQSVDSPQGTPVKRGRGRPRKNPLPETTDVKGHSSPPKKPKLIDAKPPKYISSSEEDSSDDDSMIKENWTMGKINEKIVCPICNKLFRSENVVFKHVKHCTGPSPSRSDSDKRSPRRSRLSRESETKSRESESKSRGSKNDDDEVDVSPPRSFRKTPNKRKSKDSGKSSSSDDVIPMEIDPKESDKNDAPKKNETRKSIKPKINPRTNNLVCEICGKSFRQLSYLVSHKLQHKKEENKGSANEPQTTDKSVFSCDTCKKEFRKLHHLVQHRLIHNSVQSRALRKTSSEQKELPKSQEASKLEDLSAGFRCEPCDKSFRKLHHLVEHRETHDGINRQRSNSVTQATPEKEKTMKSEKDAPPPQCDVCKKTFRKLHHLIEHKEQHLETSSEKSDDQKSVKSSLSTKDIIHECNLCYMVFPNEHSLTKHTVICSRKKKQSAAKQAATEEEKSVEDSSKMESPEESRTESVEPQPAEVKTVEEKIEKLPEKPVDPPPKVEDPQTKVDPPKPESLPKANKIEKPITEPKPVAEKKAPPTEKSVPNAVKPETPAKLKQITEIIVIEDTPKKKTPAKEKVAATVTKRPKAVSSTPLEPAVQTSSDEDEVRYMLNPNFKEDVESDFMKVRAKKRSSLQIERPNSKDLVRRRSLLQHPSKIARHRAKSDDVAPQKPLLKPKVEKVEVPSTDSDDSDVKYSFPKTVPDKPAPPEKREPVIEKKGRKTMADKRKSLSGIAKRKSLGKAIVKAAAKTSPEKPIKRRTMAAEHRCDCGQLFSSAALLARHATLAHTPPRVRRPRDAAPPAPAAPPSRKPSADKTTRPNPVKTDTIKKTAKSRNRVHGGVPLPEKRVRK